MSLGYNSRLTPISDKGLCGDPEFRDSERQIKQKIAQLCNFIRNAKYVVAFTGAGISTSCGIPDFRGPRGVWTAEQKGETLDEGKFPKFEDAVPSITHWALRELHSQGKIHHVISQNVDGLHLKSGIPRGAISELHGNIFIEKCDKCHKEFFREKDVGGMGCQPTGKKCDDSSCRGVLRDQTIDWDTPLPIDELNSAESALRHCDVLLCLGTSLRIQPAGNFPNKVLSRGGRVIVVNLQATHIDRRSFPRIFGEVDGVMAAVVENLCVGGAAKLFEMKEKFTKQWETKRKLMDSQDSLTVSLSTVSRMAATGKRKVPIEEDEEIEKSPPKGKSKGKAKGNENSKGKGKVKGNSKKIKNNQTEGNGEGEGEGEGGDGEE